MGASVSTRNLRIFVFALAFAGTAQAADLPTKAPVVPPSPPSCFSSFWDYISASVRDCPLRYGPITVYGTLDVGAGYELWGAPLGCKRAMHRVLRRALGCRGDAFRRRLRSVVARHRSILRYRRILGSGGYRHEDGQGKGKSKRTRHDDFPLGRALLTTSSTYWIADNGVNC